MKAAHVLEVFLTIDTEVWPNVPGWPGDTRLRAPDFASSDHRIGIDIEGRTTSGDFGVDYQLSVFKQCGLRATYFVEPLASGFYGKDYLRNTVIGRLLSADQDVQLHLHTEWLSDIRK